MKTRLLNDADGLRTWALIFDTGDEAHSGLTAFAREERVGAASITAIGAFARATLGYFDAERKRYDEIPIEEQVEVVALLGDIAENEGAPEVHAHVVVAGTDGQARGGHLLQGTVRPTLEVVLTEAPAHLTKRVDRSTGLPLIAVDAVS